MNCIGCEGRTNGQTDIYIYPHYLTGRGGNNVCAVANFMHNGRFFFGLWGVVGEGEMNKDHAFFFSPTHFLILLGRGYLLVNVDYCTSFLF